MSQIQTYARELVSHLRTIESEQEAIKDIVNSAKDAGANPKALRKVARELVTESDKRAKLYEDEAQLEMFRAEVGLTTAFAEAAE